MRRPTVRDLLVLPALGLVAACGGRAALAAAPPAACDSDAGHGGGEAGARESADAAAGDALAPGIDSSDELVPIDGSGDTGDASSSGPPEADASSPADVGDGAADAGVDAPGDSSLPTCSTPPAGERVLQVAVGGGRGCAVLSGGALKCWGIIGSELGLGGAAARGVVPGDMGASLPAVNLGTGAVAAEVRMGAMHTCVRLADGRVKCFGDNYYGQLGAGDTIARGDVPSDMGDNLPAVALGTGRTAVAITAGHAFSCALLDDGTVKCWGANGSGSLGQGDTANRGGSPGQMGDALPAIALGTGRTAVAISAGSGSDPYYQHACAILDDGSAKCWGSNIEGELGQGDVTARGNKAGQMGDNLAPIALGTGRTAVAMATGYVFTCAVLDDQSLKCWGSGEDTGLGRIDNRGGEPDQMGDNLPAVDLGDGKKVLAVSAGYVSACAVLVGGELKCWGGGGSILGLGDTLSRGSAPRQMGDALPAVNLGACAVTVAVSLGDSYSGSPNACARLANGTIKCWGSGGQLGLGDNIERGALPTDMGDALATVKLFSSDW